VHLPILRSALQPAVAAQKLFMQQHVHEKPNFNPLHFSLMLHRRDCAQSVPSQRRDFARVRPPPPLSLLPSYR
jgi:hypothetical protein